MKKTNLKAWEKKGLLLPAVALLLLIVTWVLHKSPVPRAIFAILSALVSLYAMLPALTKALKARELRSGLLLTVLAALLYVCCGRLVGAALALLAWNLGQEAIRLVKRRKLALLQNSRAESPLMQELPELEPQPLLSEERERFLSRYFPLLMIVLAALTAMLTVLLPKHGAGDAIRRAAVILALGGSGALFLGFPFGDLAVAICAANKGVLFRGNSLSRLAGTPLACVSASAGVPFGSATVYPARPEKLNAEMLVKLAALTLSRDETVWSERIAALCPVPASTTVRTKALKGYGVAALAGEMTVLCGNAEFMKKAGLRVYPFAPSDSVLHIAVRGFYAGCIDLDGGDADAAEALSDSGFYVFADEAEAAEKRLPGESIAFFAAGARPAACGADDLFVSSGIAEADADIVLERCGASGVAALREQLLRSKLCRKALVLLGLTAKAVLFLLALFGVCPLWLAVALEAAVGCGSVLYAMRALNANSRF